MATCAPGRGGDATDALVGARREHNRLNATHLTSRQLAEEARVPLAISYSAELGASVQRADGEKILAAFARLTGHRYTFQEIALHLRSAQE